MVSGFCVFYKFMTASKNNYARFLFQANEIMITHQSDTSCIARDVSKTTQNLELRQNMILDGDIIYQGQLWII